MGKTVKKLVNFLTKKKTPPPAKSVKAKETPVKMEEKRPKPQAPIPAPSSQKILTAEGWKRLMLQKSRKTPK